MVSSEDGKVLPQGTHRGSIVTPEGQDPDFTYSFLHLPEVNLSQDSLIDISVQLEATLTLNSNSINDPSFLILASRTFRGQDTGLFQGAYPSRSKVWRPNYCSLMNRVQYSGKHCPLFPVHIEAIRDMILRYSLSGDS